ncbi:hypothetical protein L3i23_19130 [Herbiconiux sp. L3-i23]|nr:hypothetical protein L3i23_19130 [Herbiconiux sp. L3-i23]
MQIVDGNAIAGELSGLFRADPTMLVAVCGECGAAGPLGGTMVERDDFAAIVRCRSCTHTLFTVLDEPGGLAVVIASLARLQQPAGQPGDEPGRDEVGR